jgi:hypothetical protein
MKRIQCFIYDCADKFCAATGYRYGYRIVVYLGRRWPWVR